MANKNPGSWPLGIGWSGFPNYGVAGLPPFGGNYFYVDPVNGNDGATGGPTDPLASLSQALTNCTAGQNDCVLLVGGTSAVPLTSTLTWSKSQTHLIGLGSSPQDRPVATIQNSGSTVFTPLVNVTGTGCIFQNISALHGFGSTLAQICWAEAGGLNTYKNVSFQGMNNNIAASAAGSRSITIGGAGGNTFEDCNFGTDGVIRGGINSTLEFTNVTNGNTIKRGLFQALATTGSAVHFSANSSGSIIGWQLFDSCAFIADTKNSVPNVGSTLSGVAIMSATAGGLILINNCVSVGASKWEATASNFIFINNVAANGTGGISVNNV
jgi:hypothetical protein